MRLIYYENNMLRLVFWISAAFIFYTYLGYPIIVAIWARLRRRKVDRSPYTPSISIIIAAYNEEKRIADKLQSCFDLDYPADLIDVIVASDGSTDRTNAIVRAIMDQRDNLTLVGLDGHQGKAMALNAAMAAARGEIVIFTDARQPLDRQAARSLAANFADANVGAASGELIFIDEQQRPHMGGVGLYWKYEKWLRRCEAEIHSICGATGALYAIRRSLLKPLPLGLILDDVLTPMRAVLAGYRIVFDSGARAYDYIANNADAEFARKVRTLYGNYQLFNFEPELLSPRRNPIFFQFFSHKVCRLIAPYALIALLSTNLLLMEGIYLLFLIMQIGWYLLAIGGYLLANQSKPAGREGNLHTTEEA